MAEARDYTRTVITDDLTAKYKIADIDDASSTKYFGFTDQEGAWFIMQLTSTQARYAAGSSGYPAAWSTRVDLIYDYFYNTF